VVRPDFNEPRTTHVSADRQDTASNETVDAAWVTDERSRHREPSQDSMTPDPPAEPTAVQLPGLGQSTSTSNAWATELTALVASHSKPCIRKAAARPTPAKVRDTQPTEIHSVVELHDSEYIDELRDDPLIDIRFHFDPFHASEKACDTPEGSPKAPTATHEVVVGQLTELNSPYRSPPGTTALVDFHFNPFQISA
jgi:hypothetical protein